MDTIFMQQLLLISLGKIYEKILNLFEFLQTNIKVKENLDKNKSAVQHGGERMVVWAFAAIITEA